MTTESGHRSMVGPKNSSRFDVVVLGGGMAGLCAAAAATSSGAVTAVLEHAPVIGGSAALSHGTVWTVRDNEVLRAEDPGPLQSHGGTVVAGFVAAVGCLARFGTALGDPVETRSRRARRFDLPLTFLRMAQEVQRAGGAVYTSASVDEITRDGAGFRIRMNGGADLLEGQAIVFATGGRQADPAVRADLAGAAAVLRANQYSDGGGITLARSLGAEVNFANRGFYGHLFPHGIAPLSGYDYRALALYHSTHSVLLDRAGHRFTDETAGDPRNTIALAGRGGDGVLLWSAKVQARAESEPAPVDLAIDRWAYARDRGGQVARAESAEDAGRVLRSWGFAEFADSRSARDLGDGAVFLTRVAPAVTYTYGGIRATSRGEVLDSSGDVVPGLFAAGADMSDIYHEGYCGGLSAATVTGMTAGMAAAALVSRPR
ncbi:hypothetical protein DMP23_43025 [Amycolatopsis sp. A1MSW2902]|uniref:FAD-binding protein n=1 Tax=Amycolatopsis sp. A1MSW2902 TaxID=687413 RepID=UPI00307D67D4